MLYSIHLLGDSHFEKWNCGFCVCDETIYNRIRSMWFSFKTLLRMYNPNQQKKRWIELKCKTETGLFHHKSLANCCRRKKTKDKYEIRFSMESTGIEKIPQMNKEWSKCLCSSSNWGNKRRSDRLLLSLKTKHILKCEHQRWIYKKERKKKPKRKQKTL